MSAPSFKEQAQEIEHRCRHFYGRPDGAHKVNQQEVAMTRKRIAVTEVPEAHNLAEVVDHIIDLMCELSDETAFSASFGDMDARTVERVINAVNASSALTGWVGRPAMFSVNGKTCYGAKFERSALNPSLN